MPPPTAVPEEFAPVSAAPDGAKEGGELTVLAAGDIDYMDPGAAYYQFTYMVTQADSAEPAQLAAGRRQRADAGPRRGRAGDLRGRPDDRVHDPRRGALQPAGGSRGDRGGRRVRDRALDPAGCRQPVRRDLRRRNRRVRRGRKAGRRQPDRRRPGHRGSERPRRPDAADRAGLAPEGRDREGDRPDAVAPGERTRAGGVREGVRRQEPLDVRPVRRLHRPLHGRERPRDRRADRLHAGQGDQAGPQPELGSGHRLAPRLPGRDHLPGGVRGHRRRRRGRSSAATVR